MCDSWLSKRGCRVGKADVLLSVSKVSVMTDSARKRLYVSDLYPGPRWKKKVARMPDEQITAIYLKHQSDGQRPDHSENDPEPLTEPPLVDIPKGIGPHWNEDEFQTY